MKRITDYWQTSAAQPAAAENGRKSRTQLLVTAALLAALAAILQSAGGLLPGIGYAVSPLATLPIALAALLTAGSGISAYVVTIGLLVLLQPGELFIFPFTTGLLGLAIGLSLLMFKKKWVAIFVGGSALFLGILFLVSVLRFPLFGPETVPGVMLLGGCAGFAIVYSWIWTEVILFFRKRLPFFR
ncbi:hypothetical protein [Planococcus lenghuensis]|uniref:Alpha-ribazole transporter n=1 Tax=Planococcus lenghuensis TaxID=2213202 RepID=A0A1Q2KUM8_9BACL|nr:hypothetical protein [Planococcus lenghuensis]AQQ51918.1 hypothetical protein B0X71_01475 [Planococcus lenghuensis]